MTTKFVTRNSYAEIRAVEVLRETEQSVFVASIFTSKERRLSKVGSYENYHDSWEAAHQHLMARAESDITNARRRLEIAQGFLGNVKGMKRPA